MGMGFLQSIKLYIFIIKMTLSTFNQMPSIYQHAILLSEGCSNIRLIKIPCFHVLFKTLHTLNQLRLDGDISVEKIIYYILNLF